MFKRLVSVVAIAATLVIGHQAASPHARVRVTVSAQTRAHMLENLDYARSLPTGDDRDVATAFATAYVRRFDARGTHGIAGSLA